MSSNSVAEPGDRFVEQAEYMATESFRRLTTEHPQEKRILQRLCRGGAKLITGPRGCGKTTILLKAFHQLVDDPGAPSLPVYVNFKASLRLEPLYKTKANAMYWFNQWMLFKCYIGLWETLRQMDVDESRELKERVESARRLAGDLERGEVPGGRFEMSVESLTESVELALIATGRTRCVLFLDDAAHAFSPDQQRDFFDFFRAIKSRFVAPKAAIYPGVTVVSPTFHIGHDAEEIDVWIDPYSTDYLDFMRGLVARRVPPAVFEKLVSSSDLLDVVCFAAFGMPRALLNIIRQFYEDDVDEGVRVKFGVKDVRNQIGVAYANTLHLYSSLRDKLPMYTNFVSAGESLLERMIDSVKSYNRIKLESRQSVSIAIQAPVAPELERVLGFLQYAGLMMKDSGVSRGVKGRFDRYKIHVGGLVSRNAVIGQKSTSLGLVAKALGARNAHEFTRVTPSKLLGVDDILDSLKLALPACHSCGTARASEAAKFCLNCGSPLTALSTFKTLVAKGVRDLPLSKRRVDRIREHSSLRTIGDILLDHEHRKLRGVPQIGPYWADRIYSYAEEFIA